MLSFFLSGIAGIFLGIFTGLIPGIHINMVSALALGYSAYLLEWLSGMDICIFLICMSITHTFLDSIPSIFLGAPDSENFLGVLPGHRFLLKGMGSTAVKLTLVGSFGALLISFILLPATIYITPFLYEKIESCIPYILILVILFMVFREKKWETAVFIVALSSALGIIVLGSPGIKDPLLPMLSGLFGISTLLISLRDKQTLPVQKDISFTAIGKVKAAKAFASGQFSGFLTAVLPGIGASTAAVISMQVARKLEDNGFMVLIGSVGMVNFMLSLATLYSIQKARNGIVVAVAGIVESLRLADLAVLAFAAIFAGGIAAILCLKLGIFFSKVITKLDYAKLVWCIIALIVMTVVALSGALGILIMVVATAIGIIPAVQKVSRTHAMACLTAPVILYYLL